MFYWNRILILDITSSHCGCRSTEASRNSHLQLSVFQFYCIGLLFSLKAKTLPGHLCAFSSRQPMLEVRSLSWILLQWSWTLSEDDLHLKMRMPFYTSFLVYWFHFRSPTSQFTSLMHNQDITFWTLLPKNNVISWAYLGNSFPSVQSKQNFVTADLVRYSK